MLFRFNGGKKRHWNRFEGTKITTLDVELSGEILKVERGHVGR